MAVFVYKSASVTIGTGPADLSAFVISCTLTRGVDTPESTAMGSTTHTHMAGGLRTEALEITFFQDHDASSVDDELESAIGTAAEIVLMPTGSEDDDNPQYTASWLVQEYDPASGTVGDRATTTARFVPTTAVARVKTT